MNRALMVALLWGATTAACATLTGLDEDYTVGPTGTAASTGLGGSATGTAVGGGSSAGTSTGTQSGTQSGTAGSGGSSSGGSSSGGSSSGGTGGGTSSGGSGGAGPTSQVPCVGTWCAVGQVCCAIIVSNGNDQLGCASPGQCSGEDFEINCDGPEDCSPGEICCGVRVSGSHWAAVSCESAATCVHGTGQYRSMCGGPGAPNQQHCPSGSCYASDDLSGYHYCSN